MQTTNNEEYTPKIDFEKIKTGWRVLEDGILDLSLYKDVQPNLTSVEEIMRAIGDNDVESMREISNFFYQISGVYKRLCKYLSGLYRYDWYVTPFISEKEKEKTETTKLLTNFYNILNFLDDFQVKKVFNEISLKVIRDGCYYGYLIVNDKGKVAIQELPIKYSRSRYKANGRPIVEFNMAFFDDYFRDANQRAKMLKLFPKDFQKGYILYKKGKLPPEVMGDKAGWYMLDPQCAFKFNIEENDAPCFMAVIPAIVELAEGQELDKKRLVQKLLKIIIQKMPIDKNGDLVFDVDEARALHNNVVQMIKNAVNVDVMTTFADVDVADMADRSNTNSLDELSKMERRVFNESGTAQNLFNTDGNLALEKSILNDESSLYPLILQFEDFLNFMISPFNKAPKRVRYRVSILPTTVYNYKELSKMYKEQTQLGYSKMLPAVSLGNSQSSVLANAYFENEILNLSNVFIPPMMSSTMNADVLKQNNDLKRGNGSGDSDGPGRKPLDEDEKSDKTLQNEESLS